MTNILVYDRWSKYEMFKKWLKNSKYVRIFYFFDPDKALQESRITNFDIILLGGDVDDDNLGSVKLWNMLVENELHKKDVYISTWNTDEARILKGMIPKAFYCPFSSVLANIVKDRAKNIRLVKNRKINK